MRRMKSFIYGLLWLTANSAWAIDPADLRLRMPTGNAFVRFCSSLLGTKPYQISPQDLRAKTLRKYYALLNSEKLEKAIDLYAEDSVYQDRASLYVGKAEIRERLFSSARDSFGHFSILDVSWKNHQLFVHVKFEGIQNGAPVTVEFLEVWVLNASGRIYYRQSWGFHQPPQ